MGLREDKEGFRFVQELSPDGFTIFRPLRDPSGRVVDFTWIYENPAIARFNGTDPQSIVGRRLLDIFPDHLGTSSFEAYRYVAETGESRVMEAPFQGAAASNPTWFRVVVVRTGTGNIAILAQDITERKQTEAALREGESRLKAILESLPVGIFIADSKGQLLDANPMARRIWGQSPMLPISGFKEYKAWRMDTGERLESQDWALSRAVVSGETTRDELLRIEAFDGTSKIIWHNATPVIGPNGEHYGAVSVLTDITRQKSLEDELRSSEERLSLALDAAGMGTWDWDLETNRMLWGQRMKEIWGYPSDWSPLRVQQRTERIHFEDRDRVQRAIVAALKKGGPIEMEFRIVLPAQITKWLYTSGRVIRGGSGKPVRMLGVVMDITRRKKLEIDLQASLQTRDEMIGIVSHDLKNPLGAIDLNAGALIRAKEPISTDFVNQRAENIRQSVSRMNRLISDLLDVTRIEAGQIVVRAKSYPVAFLIQMVTREVRPLAEAKGIELIEHLTCPDEQLVCDSDRIHQVFENIIGNAVKFAPDKNGRIEIRTECLADEIRFAVIDNGPGIPEEDIPHIFNRFWHSKNSKKAGTGLGLAIASGVVKAHSGRLWVESTHGKGTTFWIALPRPLSKLKAG